MHLSGLSKPAIDGRRSNLSYIPARGSRKPIRNPPPLSSSRTVAKDALSTLTTSRPLRLSNPRGARRGGRLGRQRRQRTVWALPEALTWIYGIRGEGEMGWGRDFDLDDLSFRGNLECRERSWGCEEVVGFTYITVYTYKPTPFSTEGAKQLTLLSTVERRYFSLWATGEGPKYLYYGCTVRRKESCRTCVDTDPNRVHQRVIFRISKKPCENIVIRERGEWAKRKIT